MAWLASRSYSIPPYVIFWEQGEELTSGSGEHDTGQWAFCTWITLFFTLLLLIILLLFILLPHCSFQYIVLFSSHDHHLLWLQFYSVAHCRGGGSELATHARNFELEITILDYIASWRLWQMTRSKSWESLQDFGPRHFKALLAVHYTLIEKQIQGVVWALQDPERVAGQNTVAVCL